ncbi:MAG: hypothetical protein AB7V46_25210 [Thermomicrobiales bacterium]
MRHIRKIARDMNSENGKIDSAGVGGERDVREFRVGLAEYFHAMTETLSGGDVLRHRRDAFRPGTELSE